LPKYNQLLRIEGELGGKVKYAGKEAFPVKDLANVRETPCGIPGVRTVFSFLGQGCPRAHRRPGRQSEMKQMGAGFSIPLPRDDAIQL